MLKKLVDWILYSLHLKERPPKQTAMESLLDLVPTIFAVGCMVMIAKELAPHMKPISRRQRFNIKLKMKLRKWRYKFIGY